MMKTVKKVLVLLLTVLLISTSFITAFASVVPATTETKAGAVVSIDFSYDNIAGIRGTFTISGDDIIKAIEIEKSGNFEGSYNEEEGIIAYYAASAESFVCTLNVTVKDTAVVGQECTIAFEYETTVDGKMPTVPDYKYEYATIKIGVDYDELNNQIAIAEQLKEDDYTADSWNALESTLTAAIEARNSASQDEVDAAAKALKDAIAALETKPGVVINYDELNKQIAIAEQLNEEDYTADSWSALESALAAAVEAKNATAQPVVDAAAKALKDAIAALELKPVVTVNYDELNNQIAIAEQLKEDDYTADSWNALESTLTAAIEARNSASQDEVDAAAKALKDAIAALETKPGVVINYDELNKQIAIAEQLNEEDYTADSWSALESALAAAVEAKNATAQPVVDAAAKALEDAIAALELKPVVTVNYDELNKQLDVAEQLKEKDYTAKSWKVFEAALEKAFAALSATTQEEVDTAVAELIAAMDQLELKNSDSTAESPATGDVMIIIPILLLIADLVVLFVYFSKKKSERKYTN